jgi:hypothetical protein
MSLSYRAASVSAQACSPSAQVKAAAAHVRRLKRNQPKENLILSLGVSITTLGRPATMLSQVGAVEI